MIIQSSTPFNGFFLKKPTCFRKTTLLYCARVIHNRAYAEAKSMTFILLINVKMSTMIHISTFMSRKNIALVI